MTRKKRRLMMVLLAMLGLGAATTLVLTAFQDNLVFFHSPSDVFDKPPVVGKSFRLGGLVEPGSVWRHDDGITVEFIVTDLAHKLPVVYKGALPDLFREGQGVVAEGRLGPDGRFEAREVLAKHDENYMPPEVANALQRAESRTGAGTPVESRPDVKALSRTLSAPGGTPPVGAPPAADAGPGGMPRAVPPPP